MVGSTLDERQAGGPAGEDKRRTFSGRVQLAKRENIDRILNEWSFRPGQVVARRATGDDGREVLQMRVDMGLLQLEVDGRPDGERPEGANTYLEYLLASPAIADEDFVLSEEQCEQVDQELVQFYHRRICWLALREFRLAQRDADHTLALMDLCAAHGPSEQWVLTHEQYRPFVLFHRVQAAALADLEQGGAEAAVAEIDQGIESFEALYEKYEAEEHFEEDELVRRLRELRESISQRYDSGGTLADELAQAVAEEQYERAAELRDEIARRKERGEEI